jgi:hypothetical protein
MGMGFGGVPFIYWADDKRGLKGGRRDEREEITKRGGRRGLDDIWWATECGSRGLVDGRVYWMMDSRQAEQSTMGKRSGRGWMADEGRHRAGNAWKR